MKKNPDKKIFCPAWKWIWIHILEPISIMMVIITPIVLGVHLILSYDLDVGDIFVLFVVLFVFWGIGYIITGSLRGKWNE